jgi:hypothetical protein
VIPKGAIRGRESLLSSRIEPNDGDIAVEAPEAGGDRCGYYLFYFEKVCYWAGKVFDFSFLKFGLPCSGE